MLSVIIATRDSERPLVRTLAALVPGATSGLITEVLIADAGSRDDTPAVADIAGCKLLAADEPLGRRLHAAADAARAPWLLFLQPGIVLDTPWIGGNAQFRRAPGARLSRCRVPARATGAIGVARSDGAPCQHRRHAASAGARPRHRGGFLSPDRRPFASMRPIRKAIFSAASAGAALQDSRPGHSGLILDLVKYLVRGCSDAGKHRSKKR